MAARRYEISLRVLKKYFTSERSERVKYFFNTRIIIPAGISPRGGPLVTRAYIKESTYS